MPLTPSPPRLALALLVLLLLAAAVGVAAAAGGAAFALAAVAALDLMLLGAVLPMAAVRGLILAALLLVPDLPSGDTWGLVVRWSQGLTLSNFGVPALALPLLAGAWLAGRRLTPDRWPGLARWCLALLAWGLFTLFLPGSGAGLFNAAGLAGAGGLTLIAHLAKLTLFLWLGVILVGGGEAWHRRLGAVLFVGLLANAIVGVGQAAGWWAVFSPLGRWQPGLGVRSSGLFYDANMYAILAAWALLWVACAAAAARGWRRCLWTLLALVLAGDLIGAASRAGFLALAVGALVLLYHRHWRPVLATALLFVLLAAAFPLRGWRRIAAIASPRQDAGASERLVSMAEALRQIARHPLFGLGFGRALYLGVPAVGAGPVLPVAPPAFNGAQNMPLTVWAETGPLGLALFLAAVADPLRRLRPAAAGPDQLPLLAGFVGLLAASLTIEILWNARLLALVVVLTAGVLLPHARGEAPPTPEAVP